MITVRRIPYRIVAWECSRCDRLTSSVCGCGEWICRDCAPNHICEGA